MPAPGGGPDAPHRPVLLHETVQYLAPERGGLFVDATLGLGGHSEAILQAAPETRIVGIDSDPETLENPRRRLGQYRARRRFVPADLTAIAPGVTEAAQR